MSLKSSLADWRRGLEEIAFPELCPLCEKVLPRKVRWVCAPCRARLSTLDLHRVEVNEMTDRFWGHLPVSRAAALLPFGKQLPAQRLIWKLKYDDRPDIGVALGAWLGSLLAESEAFGEVDAVVAVPLHPSRLIKRGYNQAEKIATGISMAMPAAINLSHLAIRTRSTETQTLKNRFERIENMESVFALKKPEELKGKTVLLVDDVLTTGSTLEALGLAVLQSEPKALKVATLALARNW